MADTRCRTACTRAWVTAVLVWSLARTVVVARTLGRYGVDPWAYGALDLAVSWPYAMATAGIVTNLVDGHRRAARRSAVLAVVSFLVPDVYLVLAGHGKPTLVYVVVVAAALLLAASALLTITLQLRAGRKERAQARLEAQAHRHPKNTSATPWYRSGSTVFDCPTASDSGTSTILPAWSATI